MKKYIRTTKGKYLIRGSWSEDELKKQYKAFIQKFSNYSITFDEWLVSQGKVYLIINEVTD